MVDFAAAVAVVALLVSGPWRMVGTSAASSSGAPVSRLAGSDAVGTALAVSSQSFGNGAAHAVVLARSDYFADALAGGPLAVATGGPLLITPGAGLSSTLDPRVAAEIQRVLPSGRTVYILGGTLALSPGIDSRLTGLGYRTVRVAGVSAAATAVAVAEQLGNPTTVFEATGTAFPDALSAVPAAIEEHAAILLTDGPTQDPATAAYLSQHPTDVRYAVGGPLAAAGADPHATAVYGDTLYDTSAAIASRFFPNAVSFGAATGMDYPDALAGGVFMTDGGRLGPVLLVAPSAPLPNAVAGYLGADGAISSGWLFGGTDAVGADVAAALTAATSAGAGGSPSAPSPGGPASVGTTLGTNQTLQPNQELLSSSAQYQAIMQGDGNFVEYGPGGVVWASNTGVPGSTVTMQGDGNLVVYAPGGQPVWSSNTAPASNAHLSMQDDGNLVMYSGGTALWSHGQRLTPSGPSGTPVSGQAIVDEATKWINQVPYCFDGGTFDGPSHGASQATQQTEGATDCLSSSTVGFDCTGLTLYAAYQASGGAIKLPHDGSQATAAVAAGGQEITSTSDLQPGDLVFFGGSFSSFEHSGVYVGNGNIVDANIAYPVGSQTRPDGVHEEPLTWQYSFVGAVRF